MPEMGSGEKRMETDFKEELRGIIREELREVYKLPAKEGEALITSEEAAMLLGIKPQTLAVWRSRSYGPNYKKISESAVRYSRQEVEQWIEAQSVRIQ